MKIKLNKVRIAFPQLFEAKTVNGEGEPAFSCTLLLGPDHPQLKEINDAVLKVATEKWGAKTAAVMKEMQMKDRLPLHDGDTKSDYAGFPGNHFISARNKVRPTVLNRDKSPLTAQDGLPYAGCYVHASIELWAQDNSYGKRVNASLRGVQFTADGEAFSGGGAASEDEFDSEDEDSLV